MQDSDYRRPVGLNILNGIKSELKMLKTYLGDSLKPTGAVYAEIVFDDRVQGLHRTEALWFKLICAALEICDLNQPVSNVKNYVLLLGSPTEDTGPSKKDTLRGRSGDIKSFLNRALSELNKYEPKQDPRDVDFRIRFPDKIEHPNPQADAREEIRQRRLALKWGLIQDVNKCMTLATVFAAYCKRMDPYLGITPTQKWEDCDLSIYLQQKDITKEDAGRICACLGAIRPEHLAHIQDADMLIQSIPVAARTALIKVVQAYRAEHKITSKVDTSLTVGKHSSTLTSATVCLLQMRSLVEIL